MGPNYARGYLLGILLLLLFPIGVVAQPYPPTQCVTTAIASGSGDAIVLPQIPCWPSTTLLLLTTIAANVTTAPTISVNGDRAVTVVTYTGAPLGTGTFQPNGTFLLTYNGTNWKLLNPPITVAPGTIGGPANSVVGDIACWNNTTGTLLADCGALGTIAHQDASNVNITGGAISNVTINNSAFTGGNFQGNITNLANISGGTYTSPTINGGTLNSPTILGGTINGATLTNVTFSGVSLANSTITNPTINGGTANNFQVASIPQNNVTSNYSINTSDCGKLLYLTGGEFTITFSNGFTSGCIVTLVDDDIRSKQITGVLTKVTGTPYRIWPGQQLSFAFDGNNWDSTGPQRFATTGGQLWVGPPGTCNDGFDGLVSSAPICDGTVAAHLAEGTFTCQNGAGVIINLLPGTYNAFSMTVTGPPPPGCSDQIAVTGVFGAPETVSLVCSSTCFNIQDHAIVTLTGVTMSCPSSPATMLLSRQFAVLDVNNVVTGNCPGGSIAVAQDTGHINILVNGLVISGNVSDAFNASGTGSLISSTAGPSFNTTIITSNPITINNFAIVSGQAELRFGPTQIAGGGSVTGTRWAADSLGLIYTSGSGVSCNSFFNNAGTVNGSAANGAICN